MPLDTELSVDEVIVAKVRNSLFVENLYDIVTSYGLRLRQNGTFILSNHNPYWGSSTRLENTGNGQGYDIVIGLAERYLLQQDITCTSIISSPV